MCIIGVVDYMSVLVGCFEIGGGMAAVKRDGLGVLGLLE